MNNLRILFLSLITVLAVGCSDYYDLYPPAELYEDEVFSDITKSQQYINTMYESMSIFPDYTMDYYTDNAVNRSGQTAYAVSGYSAEASPVEDYWGESLEKIININEFFEIGFDVEYDSYDAELSEQLKSRIRGEAYGLRAYYKWILLKNFGGPSAADPSVMLGFPLFDDIEVTTDNVNSLARATYLECYNSIMGDIDAAFAEFEYLGGLMRYSGSGTVTGLQQTGRVCGEMLYALQARVALYAASEAYGVIELEDALAIIYNVIKVLDVGEVIDLQAYGDFSNTENIDHLWRSTYANSNTLEYANLPPSQFGSGNCNPTQNLVDAFPSAAGYPMEAGNPSSSRDGRFSSFIFYNGLNSFGSRTFTVYAYEGGLDADGGLLNSGTRTGYYLKKFLGTSINLDPNESGPTSSANFNVVFDRAMLYLDFAEAAAHVYGAEDKGDMYFSSYDALKKVRERAGIAVGATDGYMDEIKGDADAFMDLIVNERRLETCFTGERFYDVRRLKLPVEDLAITLTGQNIYQSETSSTVYTYELKDVEERYFVEKMYYNPIPPSEIVKSDALIQNYGW